MRGIPLLVLIALILSSALLPANADGSQSNSTSKLVSVTYTKFQTSEQHIFLNPGARVSFNTTEQLEGFNGYEFRSTHVSMNATNSSFLTKMGTDLYIETNNYLFGGTVGAWASNESFSINNPTTQTQEIFLHISNSYVHVAYATDFISGDQHTITFTTNAVAADQFSVNWGFFGELVSLDVNGSQIDPYSVSSSNRIRMEDVSSAAVFYSSMTGTSIAVKVQEGSLAIPTSPYIGAWIFKHNFITLNPHQEYTFNVPAVNGWTYAYGVIDANITLSLYPQPYPFKLVNLAVYDPYQTPLLATPTNTTFGISNLSDQTYAVYFDTTLYYWQNQTSSITYSDQVNVTESSVYHNLSVTVPNATVGSELGLSGQYVAFRSVGNIVGYSAPDPVGRYQSSYMPLRSGNYNLVTADPRIMQETTISMDDFSLKATISVNVTYNGNPYPNANVTVNQKGTFTDRTYRAISDLNGQAVITVSANAPETDQFTINVAKDTYNTANQVLSATIGTIWIVFVAAMIVIISVALIYVKKLKKTIKD